MCLKLVLIDSVLIIHAYPNIENSVKVYYECFYKVCLNFVQGFHRNFTEFAGFTRNSYAMQCQQFSACF